ncbi:MAG: filamentous hemagglutinin N-terminal domain-containing protein, partial [Gloeobacteraceae cyanobacterium ES-bin-144]|nr:filamentous hemagglutinin N-terminal domain-containing protein [Verrucomicrobiales bacterium]
GLRWAAIALVTLPLAGSLGMGQVLAQAVTPARDGTRTTVTRQGNRLDISGGQRSRHGRNLFHSFRQFGLSANQIANFQSNPQIRNILARVTGGDASVIDGILRVKGGGSLQPTAQISPAL